MIDDKRATLFHLVLDNNRVKKLHNVFSFDK